MTAALFDLIAKLEKAEKGSHELDCEIGRAIGLKLTDDGWMECPNPMEPDYPAVIICPNFTSSIDTALALVPEGVFINLDRYSLSDRSYDPYAWRCWAKWMSGNVAGDGPVFHREVFSGARPTPALALCLAALRARAA